FLPLHAPRMPLAVQLYRQNPSLWPRTCSKDATIWIYLCLGRLFKNFLTILDSSMFSPNEAALDARRDIFPAKSSNASLSSSFNLSDWGDIVCTLACLTRLEPRWREVIACRMPVGALGLTARCIQILGVEWKKTAIPPARL